MDNLGPDDDCDACSRYHQPAQHATSVSCSKHPSAYSRVKDRFFGLFGLPVGHTRCLSRNVRGQFVPCRWWRRMQSLLLTSTSNIISKLFEATSANSRIKDKVLGSTFCMLDICSGPGVQHDLGHRTPKSYRTLHSLHVGNSRSSKGHRDTGRI